MKDISNIKPPQISAKEQIESLLKSGSLEAKFNRGFQSIVHFLEEFIVEPDSWLEPAEYHFKLSNLLLHGQRNMCIEAFRESGKTSLVLVGFPLYRLMNPGKNRFYLLIVTKSASESAEKIRFISETMQENPLFSWNISKVHKDSNSEGGVFEVTTKMGERIRIEGAGKGSSIRGSLWRNHRPDVVVLDDIQDNDDMYSDNVLMRDWNWFNSDVKFLSRHGRVFMIGNNLGEKCLIERVIDKSESLGFDTLKIPVLDEHGKSAWPAKYSEQDVMDMRNDAISSDTLEMFERELMCNAVAEEGKLFPREFFRYYDPKDANSIAKQCNIYILTDYAVSEKKTADYRVVLVLGINSEGMWFILDCDYGRWAEDEFEDRCIRAVQKWKPLLMTFEVHAQQRSAMTRLMGEMVRRKVSCQIVPVTAGSRSQAKFLMIKELQPLFANGKVWFPKEAHWLGEMVSELGQITKSGKLGKFDDLVNALAYGLHEKILPPSDLGDIDGFEGIKVLGSY